MHIIKPRRAFVDTDTIRLHYLEWDSERIHAMTSPQQMEPVSTEQSDTIPVVMLHALGATAETWSLVANHLYTRHLLIAFDLRGHGRSDQPESGYDLATIAEDVIQGMAALGLGQVALVGHGWGARVALALTARHPALISHLILVDCPHVEPRHWPGMTRERFIREMTPKEIYTSMQSYLRAMRSEMSSFWSPEVEAIIKTYVRELPDGSVEERLKAASQRQIREVMWEDRALSYYSKLTCPVLLVPAAAEPRAGEDLPERLEQADEFAIAKGHMAQQVARTIANCSVLWMPDTAHDIQLQRPAVLAAAIADFIKE